MGFDLPNLIQPVPGLEELSQPFSDAEIMHVLKEMPPAEHLVQMVSMACLLNAASL